jgi:phage gpG-like protein
MSMVQRSRKVPAAEKAVYHQIAGAGKSRIKREFFGLTPQDMDDISVLLERRLSQRSQLL